MPDAQRIVDDIRTFVHASDQTNNPSLQALAADYAAVCKEANDRLRRCDEFLRQGLRSEAIRFAEAEPALLDVLAQLDFPERPQWAELGALYGLAPAPELRLEVAEALNRAYAEEQPLQQLLRNHRRLALARASLGERLGVLRQIIRADPGNPVWEQDVTAFEKVRLGQMEADARAAFDRKDFGALNTIWTELNTPGWVMPLPMELLDGVGKLLQAGTVEWTLQRLSELAGRLENAFQLLDLDTARQLAEEWRNLARTVPLPPTSQLPRRVAPVLQWISQQEMLQRKEAAYQEGLYAFQRALADPAVCEDALTQCYDELRRRAGGRVSAQLKEAYRQRLDVLGARSSRRERIVLAITFAGGALALLGFILFLFLRQH
jgi:hypothetical protein